MHSEKKQQKYNSLSGNIYNPMTKFTYAFPFILKDFADLAV